MSLSRDTQFTAPGLPGGKEGSGHTARTQVVPGGPPVPPALQCSDASRRPLQRPPALQACGRGREGEGKEGKLPARKRSAGWPESSLTLRAGHGLGHTGRDKPGVLIPRLGLLLPGDGMLDIWAGRVEASQAQLGRKGHVPGWGCWRRGGEAERCLAPGARGADGIQANPPSSPAWTGQMYPQHRLQEAAYQRGCPMSSALIRVRAETFSMTVPTASRSEVGAPPALTPLPWHKVGGVARLWPRALCRLSRREHCFPSCACWARSSGTLRPQRPVGQASAYRRATHQTICFSHKQGEVPASGGPEGPPDTGSRRQRGSPAFVEHMETQRVLTESDFPMECSRTCHFNMSQGESWGRGNGSQ